MYMQENKIKYSKYEGETALISEQFNTYMPFAKWGWCGNLICDEFLKTKDQRIQESIAYSLTKDNKFGNTPRGTYKPACPW